MNRISPFVWISIGLVSLTLSLMLVGSFIVDLTPNQDKHLLEYRRSLTEALAVQYSKLAERGDSATIKLAMLMLVERTEDVRSAALRTVQGAVLAKAGDHDRHWVQSSDDRSTFDHVQVPIFSGNSQWGTLQVAFEPAYGLGIWGVIQHPWVKFLGIVTTLGFIGYLIFMKGTLRHLDPSAMVPKRVKAALDVLAEGVVLLDTRGFIVLANTAFSDRVGRPSTALLGQTLSDLPWEAATADLDAFPWNTASEAKRPATGVRLLLAQPLGDAKRFIVNSAPILDERGGVRGVLTSFDDVTELDQANTYLSQVIEQLESSQSEVLRQNEELARLATRDPLTGCFNRRALFQQLQAALATAQEEGSILGCMMIDIDLFKSFNDRHGHSLGDQVINVVARTINATIRPNDFLGRYGGEEFCVVMPGAGNAPTYQVAERIRRRIASESGAAIRSVPNLQITASVGISSTEFGVTELTGLIDQADKALYAAKQGGRNRVVSWELLNLAPGTAAAPAAGNPAPGGSPPPLKFAEANKGSDS